GSGIRNISINLVWRKLLRICSEKNVSNRFIVSDVSPDSLKVLKKYKFRYRHLSGFHLAPIMVTPNKTLIFNFKNLSVISITSPTIAEQFRFFFESLWAIAKEGS
ncbi:MAG: hypothetical protein KAT35_00130, partial [Candidatus Aenigmarchaeota archaeon]|nr:hypothetical protein [Candidatus Aenigmarchaeota archaeon]